MTFVGGAISLSFRGFFPRRSVAFEDIAPYADAEVPQVLARLGRDDRLIAAAAKFVSPSLSRWFGPVFRPLVGARIRRELDGIDSVRAFQTLLARGFAWMVDTTTDGLTVTGVEGIDPEMRYLFVSNHRDIALDSAFVNYALYRAGHPTTRLAFGDNLLATGFAADVMRLNKGFVVKRSAKAGKAGYAAMLETSQYIRVSLDAGESVWIAQRDGRAKDGWDKTDAALVKMFALAFRKETEDLATVVSRLGVLPVAISYELDPCDVAKAREVSAKARGEVYEKAPGEDLRSVIRGVTGAKGRVHLNFGTPLTGPFADAEAIATAIDRQIVAGYRLFPTHYWAAARAGVPNLPVVAACPALEAHLAACPEPDRDALIAQYANPVKHARALDLI